MQAVGRIGSYITRGVCGVSGPFLPFGGAVDIVVVQQKDGSFKSSPWYVRFGKFQRVMKTREREKVEVNISVNGVEPDFHMYLNHKGEAFFLHSKIQEEEDGGESVWCYGDSNDIQPLGSKRQFESKSCNFDSQRLSSEAQVDKIVGNRSGSRRSSVLGLVFGSRAWKGEEDIADTKKGVDLLERAEIAAKLLELKWSTNLTLDQLPHRDRKKTRGDSDNLDNGVKLNPCSKIDEKACCSCIEQDGIGSICVASAGCGKVHVHAGVLHATTLLLPEVNLSAYINTYGAYV